MKENNHDYDDIINLPHHVSKTHRQMAISDRAAQFAPFAALTGYEAVIQETARLTDRKIELDEYAKAELDEQLQMVREQASYHPEITVTYFVPDERKNGGTYITTRGRVKKVDEYNHTIMLEDGAVIGIDEIIAINTMPSGLMP